jgi:hypothetical protein
MKDKTMKKLVSLLILSLATLFCPAYCQKQGHNSLASKLPPGRSMRVTTGSVEVRGWERGLIERSPNLARWHWDPLYSTTQGYVTAPTVAPPLGSRYPKPIHVNTVRPPQSRSAKPTHIPFNLPTQENAREDVLAHRLDRPNQVSARENTATYLKWKDRPISLDKTVSGELQKKPSEDVATYGEAYNKELSMGEKHIKANVYGHLQGSKHKKTL